MVFIIEGVVVGGLLAKDRRAAGSDGLFYLCSVQEATWEACPAAGGTARGFVAVWCPTSTSLPWSVWQPCQQRGANLMRVVTLTVVGDSL